MIKRFWSPVLNKEKQHVKQATHREPYYTKMHGWEQYT